MSSTVRPSRLMHFPVPLFAMVMGSLGFSVALMSGATIWPFLYGVGAVVMWGAIILFAGLAATYIAKCLRYSDAVKLEWNHPVKLAFFPAISISLLLMAIALLLSGYEAARGVWLVGAGLQGILTIAVISGWISHRAFEVGHLTPAWFIPAVGNVIAPIAGARLGYVELSWLFFSAGILFWLVLLTLVFNRLIFHNPMPAKLLPTLVILIAPPSVGYLGYVALSGQVDAFARILLNSGYIFTILVLVQSPKLVKLPFALSWWALSFPVAALTAASFGFAEATGSVAHSVIGTGLLVLLCVIMVALFFRTIQAALRDQICVPD
ncbi:SLAC1 anion channel family protein [uncultured Shimia sp.]|uniref:SLAC1 anion channel family protein n=1 Tax=uncultured Shimia sp. TaxID=573152 RepID=UPI002612FCAE|nr:SLAC1 anion channel family protein [uncultured Shimia sp.]